MSSNLILTLQITAIGMGLVFGAIILLWGVMALLVRLSEESENDNEDVIIISAGKPVDSDQKQLEAAAAVAVALAKQNNTTEPRPFPLPPTATVSAWQAVLRTQMLAKRRSGR